MPALPLPHLLVVPGERMVLFVVCLEGEATTLAVPSARFLEGLKAGCDVLSFGPVHRADDALEELLPWAGNV
jgi:hypothetical protein